MDGQVFSVNVKPNDEVKCRPVFSIHASFGFLSIYLICIKNIHRKHLFKESQHFDILNIYLCYYLRTYETMTKSYKAEYQQVQVVQGFSVGCRLFAGAGQLTVILESRSVCCRLLRVRVNLYSLLPAILWCGSAYNIIRSVNLLPAIHWCGSAYSDIREPFSLLPANSRCGSAYIIITVPFSLLLAIAIAGKSIQSTAGYSLVRVSLQYYQIC